MPSPIAVCDACVLYPAPLRDLLIHLALADLFRARWTAAIHAERLPDPGDHHILAAAVKAGADVIVTFNLKHFPEESLSPHGVRSSHPDHFVCGLFDQNPDLACNAVRE